jgi:uncharacterized protein (DUF3084 family)
MLSAVFVSFCYHCFQVLEQTLQEVCITESDLHAVWQNKDQELSELDSDLQEQAVKLERAEKQLHKSVREVKGLSLTKPMILEEVSSMVLASY